jgi:hypothetical protein
LRVGFDPLQRKWKPFQRRNRINIFFSGHPAPESSIWGNKTSIKT